MSPLSRDELIPQVKSGLARSGLPTTHDLRGDVLGAGALIGMQLNT
jgi:hypothetical protein